MRIGGEAKGSQEPDRRFLRVCQVPQPAHEEKIFHSRQTFIQGGELSSHADDLVDLLRLPDHIKAPDPGSSPVRAKLGGQYADCGGLPGAVGAKKSVDGPCGD